MLPLKIKIYINLFSIWLKVLNVLNFIYLFIFNVLI